MKKFALLTIIITSILLSGCFNKKADYIDNDKKEVEIANPASVYCEEQGGTIEMREGEGGVSGICKFTDGSECEEWKFFNKECEPGVNTGGVDLSTDDWPAYEKKDKNIKIKHHNDWHYIQDEQSEKELGYDLFVGFADSQETLDKGKPYPIELIIASADKEIHKVEYSETVISLNNLNYILTVNSQEKYGEIFNKMAKTLQVIIGDQGSEDSLREIDTAN